ncbi:MAG: zinc-dependent alcohol dehydrogenase family protein [Novosphingobium sp.]|nr:zinc-dependent alcohol dehydrogenase family protein [Novosphingobium sp.]
MVTGYAMQFDRAGAPLRRIERVFSAPAPGEVLLEVLACGVCRTDLHVADGEIAARYPIVPGHEIVGQVVESGAEVTELIVGQRVGVCWLGSTCGHCRFCRSDHENLCDTPVFTGATRDGGYASHVLANADYCFALPDAFGDVEAAPLLCAGLIGHRALTMAGPGEALALYGFGAAAHIIAQVAVWEQRRVYALTRPGDTATQEFARSLGCTWAGGSDQLPPEPVDAAIIFAAAGELVPQALRAVLKGGRVVCAGIHMSDIPSFPYADLWGERSIVSVANLTRADGAAFLELAGKVPVQTTTTAYPLERANQALADLRAGRLEGAAVLVP